MFQDENALIAKNSSVIVRRIPGLRPGGILSQQEMAGKNERYAEKNPADVANGLVPSDPPTQDFPKIIEGADEADRIASLISQSSNALDMFPLPPTRGRYNNRGSFRGGRGNRGGRGGRGGRGAYGYSGHGPGGQQYGHGGNNYPDRAPRPSANYVCHRCNLPGHWIDQCPTNGDPTYDKIKVRAPTGIPRSMLRQVDAPESGTGLQDSSGQFVTLQPNEEEFARQTVGLRLSQAAAAAIEKRVGEMHLASASGERGEVAITTGQDDVAHGNSTVDAEGQGGTLSTADDQSGAIEAVGEQQEKALTDGSTEKEPSDNESKQQSQDQKLADSTAASRIEGFNTKLPSPNGIHPGGGHGTSRHVNKSNMHGRRGNNPPRTGMPIPGVPPLPGAPPGFPMGLPPFPPGLPPPPPHILMAMAAAAQQGVVPPLPPGMLPPNVPFPFPPPIANSDREGVGNDLAMPQQPGFQQFVAVMQGQGGNTLSAGGEKQGESGEDEQGAGEGSAKITASEGDDSGLSPNPKLSNSQEGPISKENCTENADTTIGPGLDHSNSEKVESSQNSKPDSRHSRGRADVSGDRNDHRKRDSYQNGNDVSHDRQNSQEMRFSRRHPQSSRDQSLSPQRRSPLRERYHSPSRRVEGKLRGNRRDELRRGSGRIQRGRGHEDRNVRSEVRRGRMTSVSPLPHDRDRVGNHSPLRGRHHRSSRRRSPSPSRVRSRGGLNRAPRGFPPRDSPVSRRRFLDYHDEGRYGSPMRGQREPIRTPSPALRDRYDRRNSRQPRSPLRSPRSPDGFRYDRLHDDDLPMRSFDQLRRSRSPVANGNDFFGRSDDDRVKHRRRENERYVSRGYPIKSDESDHPLEPVNGRLDHEDMESSDHYVPPLSRDRGRERDVSPIFREGRPRSPRSGAIRGEDRIRREREYDDVDGMRAVKKTRRDRTPDGRHSIRLEHRDRRSVHDRLGQPREKRRNRKSVHDRLG